MIFSLIISLILTVVIEISVSFMLGIRNKIDFIVVICVNVCTNPIVVYIANCILYFGYEKIYSFVVIIMELLVIIVEYFMYKKYLTNYKKSPLKLSIINNVVSYGLGVFINICF